MIAPALVTLLVLVAIVIALLSVASSLVEAVLHQLPSWLAGVGAWVVWAVVGAGLVTASLLMFVTVAGIVAGPFHEMLSEAVEAQLTGVPAPRFALLAFARGALVGLVHGLRRLLVAVLGIALLFAISFVPVVGTIAAVVLGAWGAARSAAYDCYDAVLSRRELGYRAKLAFLDANRARTVGLGAIVAALLLVPGVNLVAIGIGAAGATLAERELAIVRAAAAASR